MNILPTITKFRELVNNNIRSFKNLNRIERMCLTLVSIDNNLNYSYETVNKYKDINIITLKTCKNEIIFDQRELNLFTQISGQTNLMLNYLDEDSLLASFQNQLDSFKHLLSFISTSDIKRLNIVVTELICEYISELPKYKEFILEDIKEISTEKYAIFRQLCNKSNEGQQFTSIDLTSANFLMMKNYGVFEEDSWKSFIEKFIKCPLFSDNKYIRVKIIGKLTNKWSVYVNHEMIKLRELCLEQNPTIEILGIENDEILIKGFVDLNLPEYAKLTRYTLKYFELDKKTLCYVKMYEDGNKKIKHYIGNRHDILKFVDSLKKIEI